MRLPSLIFAKLFVKEQRKKAGWKAEVQRGLSRMGRRASRARYLGVLMGKVGTVPLLTLQGCWENETRGVQLYTLQNGGALESQT